MPVVIIVSSALRLSHLTKQERAEVWLPGLDWSLAQFSPALSFQPNRVTSLCLFIPVLHSLPETQDFVLHLQKPPRFAEMSTLSFRPNSPRPNSPRPHSPYALDIPASPSANNSLKSPVKSPGPGSASPLSPLSLSSWSLDSSLSLKSHRRWWREMAKALQNIVYNITNFWRISPLVKCILIAVLLLVCFSFMFSFRSNSSIEHSDSRQSPTQFPQPQPGADGARHQPFVLPVIEKDTLPLPPLSSLTSPEDRRRAVRNAFHHAWTGYHRYAWGHDEIRPTTNGTSDSWGGWG